MRLLFLITISFFVLSCAGKTGIRKVQLPEDRRINRTQYEAFGEQYAIATQGSAATLAAKSIFDLGGNIFDAAVSASFVISVERPQSTGIGGGGFMVLHHAKENKTYAIDFREKAPLKAFETMYQDKNADVIQDISSKGILSVGVPGTVAGIIEIHKKFGTLPLSIIVAPAITLAENGFKVYPHLEKSIAYRSDMFEKDPYAASIFFNSDHTPKKTGDVLVQKDLAKTLREIANQGRDGFYNSWVTDKILAKSKKEGGLLTKQDFDQYDVRYREPIKDDFNDYKIVSMPTPSSGGVHILEILNILDPFNLKKMGMDSSQAIHLTSSAMQQAFSDRAKYMGDGDFVSVPSDELISDAYADKVRATISLDRAKKSDEVGSFIEIPHESNETTHFSIMDSQGNVVSTTQTINYWLGSGVVVDGTGIVLNNEMDDFSSKPGHPNIFGAIGGIPNAIEAEKRPLSSMSPTIVFDKEGTPMMAVGAPGGAKIISCVLHTLLNYLEYDLPLYESVNQLRYHHQWYPDEIRVEPPAFSKEVAAGLEQLGYTLTEKNIGCKVQAVTKEGRKLHSVSDIRGEGRSYAE